eukprot:9387717-Karenia_brevis.AAC.1
MQGLDFSVSAGSTPDNTIEMGSQCIERSNAMSINASPAQLPTVCDSPEILYCNTPEMFPSYPAVIFDGFHP